MFAWKLFLDKKLTFPKIFQGGCLLLCSVHKKHNKRHMSDVELKNMFNNIKTQTSRFLMKIITADLMVFINSSIYGCASIYGSGTIYGCASIYSSGSRDCCRNIYSRGSRYCCASMINSGSMITCTSIYIAVQRTICLTKSSTEPYC